MIVPPDSISNPSRWVFLGGTFVSRDQACVSAFDRGFLYGDGLFETMRLHQGQAPFWSRHLERLLRSAAFLRMRFPSDPGVLRDSATKLWELNESPAHAILRIQLSRGPGERGYSPVNALEPLLVMTLHPAPALRPASPARLQSCPWPVCAEDPTLQHKTCSKMFQILARSHAEQHAADDSLLSNHRFEITETTSSNIFWVADSEVSTPPLACGLLPGITRRLVIELASKLGLVCVEKSVTLPDLMKAEGVFITQSSRGLMDVSHIDGQTLRTSPLTQRLRHAFLDEYFP